MSAHNLTYYFGFALMKDSEFSSPSSRSLETGSPSFSADLAADPRVVGLNGFSPLI
ncbi:hypothetical protein [Sorangium sp. So ce1151]|uniref:hypothetical protein n=1 Tax=Sorangium sp. So ce1151 TaxID=3133332 RepID=UPI003F61D124